MKTTLNIADSVMKELKREAARQGRTMSELVEAALRRLLQQRDVANREALYQAMEE
jgi:metal-responsive CopG/Arc/MetJ family transcriptional regulator